MSTERPLVSICVPTRNRGAVLRDAILNICAQDYAPIEILISDNASEDNTEAVCRQLAAEDSRIRYVRHDQNLGLHGNHNFCMDQGRGEFLCIFHDHDRRASTVISEYVAFLQRHPRVGVVCADWELIDDTGAQIGVRDYPVAEVTSGNDYIEQTMRSGQTSIGIAGAMIRRAALADIRFVLDAPIGFGDFPLWFRMAESWDIGHLRQRLWSWRQNDVSHSARPIESIAGDYAYNIGRFCDEFEARHPERKRDADRWRLYIRRFLFWALTYEVGLHFRSTRRTDPRASRSLFEIMNYRLTPTQFANTLAQMRRYRSGLVQHVAYVCVTSLVRLRFTAPLAWATQYRDVARTLLKLR